MKILVTGAKGFIAKNLIVELSNYNKTNANLENIVEIYKYSHDMEDSILENYCKDCDFVFHLAGVNRTTHSKEFIEGNLGFIKKLTGFLEKANNKSTIVFTSSLHVGRDTEYAKSKEMGENCLIDYAERLKTNLIIYRLPNVFGKWALPNYNSAITTFCHNIAHDLSIRVDDRKTLLTCVYIDDILREFISDLSDKSKERGIKYKEIHETYKVSLGHIVDLIYSFKNSRSNLLVPDMKDQFVRKLYATYLSYLPKEDFGYTLKSNIDYRGSFTEFLKTENAGQVSINVSKPGIIKGEHWHHTKNEKFLVVSGKGVIRFRNILSEEVEEYFVSDKKYEVIDIPTGYVHNIENIGDSDMITIMWASEIFDKNRSDTYYLKVKGE